MVALLIRLWGIKSGLPYAFNSDENAHFVPKAIGLFGHSWEPPGRYFVNPPAFTYLLHVVFAVWFGGREGVYHAFATDPGAVFAVGRVCAAVLGTLAVWLVYLAGARFFDRRVGLLGAALMAVSFLPVFYSRLALNDVPTLAPLCLSLWGVAGVLRGGRTRDYVVAGAGLGLATATKYTGGIVIVPLLAACGAQMLAPAGRGAAVRGLLAAAACALAAFVIANPYAVIDFSAFRDGLSHQTTAADADLGKLGLSQTNGYLYYLWTLSWGMGWVALLGAIGGALALARDERRLAVVLVPAPLLFVLFMGSQTRFFGRWLLPIFPIVALLAAYFLLELAEAAGRRRPALRPALATLAALALCGQGLVYSVHGGLVNAREDTRNIVRRWMVDHIPVRAKIVVEPVAPDGWAQDVGRPSPLVSNGNRWTKYPTSRSLVDPLTGERVPPPGMIVNIEDYERTLTPALIRRYEAGGYCWVVTGSTQRGRAEAEPATVPQAVAYYDTLDREAVVAFRATPFAAGHADVPFNFDWSFDYYPLAYHRPGPVMTVYRLQGGRCAGVS
ncbi:MAG TPA: glycosyltransferase family 39 protein [Solirubrobacteraceae bacterium]|nr:glycosyltransferase family 39 protein [Solirubrobacteraceae bacterium]